MHLHMPRLIRTPHHCELCIFRITIYQGTYEAVMFVITQSSTFLIVALSFFAASALFIAAGASLFRRATLLLEHRCVMLSDPPGALAVDSISITRRDHATSSTSASSIVVTTL